MALDCPLHDGTMSRITGLTLSSRTRVGVDPGLGQKFQVWREALAYPIVIFQLDAEEFAEVRFRNRHAEERHTVGGRTFGKREPYACHNPTQIVSGNNHA